MVLADSEILREMEAGNIVIENFSRKQLNGASYNVRLDDTLLIYDTDYTDENGNMVKTENGVLDMKKKNPTKEIQIPEEGLVIYPGRVYLGMTKERTCTGLNLEPIFDGRSSVGRLGIFVHVTAGYGDPGFDGHWTLEISPIQPIRIYPNVNIGQVYYQPLKGKCLKPYSGKYQGNRGVQASMMYKDFDQQSPVSDAGIHDEQADDWPGVEDPWETKQAIAAGR